MELKAGYKQTEIGLIPSDWGVKELGDLSEKIMVGIASAATHAYRDKGIVLFRNQNIKRNYLDDNDILFVTEEYEQIFKGKRLKSGDLLTARTGYPGTTCIIPKQYENAQSFTTLITRPNTKAIESDFLCFYMNSEKGQSFFETNQIGGGQKNVNAGTLKIMPIPIPTKTEQTLIATALSDADALISSLEKLIAKKRNIKQGAMQKLLQPKEGWEVKKLGEIAFVNMGQSPLSQFYNSEEIGLPLVQGNADVENRKTIIRFYTSMITKKGKVGDIIMSVRAPVGEISKATFDCCLGRGVCSISFDNEYLYHYLIYFEKSWAKLSTGSTFDSVNSKQVKELEIPIPKSKEEQTRIATILSDMDTEITALETKLEKYKKVKLGMMQNLLTGKIRLV